MFEESMLPASCNQQWLWLLDNLASTSWYYNMPIALVIHGFFNLEAFSKAFEQLLKRHDSLRTVFRNKEGKIYRLILEQYELPITVTGADSFSDEDIKKQVAIEAKTHFKLNANHLLIKAHILHFNPSKNILLLTMHHSIFDGWSYDIFFSELADLYAYYAQGKPSQLQPIPQKYSDFVNWQNQFLKSQVTKDQLQFWKTSLNDTPLLQFPTDYARPEIQSYEGKYYPFTLGIETVKGLYQLANETRTSPFMVALCAFYTLLARYANQTDFVFGVPLAGRHPSNMDKIIGYFTNIIALRINAKESISFQELLQHVKTLLFEIYDNQYIPFGKVIEQLNIKRDLSRNPLFQVLFAYQNVGINKLSLPDLSIEPYREGYDAARFDFTFEIEDRKDTMQGGIYYNLALFSEQTIAYMIESYKEILKQVILQPECKLSELSLLGPNTNARLIEQTNSNFYQPISDFFIRDIIDTQTQLYPEQCAVKYENTSITYRELNSKANQLVHFLLAKGLSKGSKIGIGTGRSISLIIGIVACFKAGFIYIPLDTTYPVERLKFIVQDADISAVLTLTPHQMLFKDFDQRMIDLQKEEIFISEFPKVLENQILSPEDTAYIFYTSGTTGNPKGSCISHYNIVNLIESAKNLFDFGHNDKALMFHSYAFDVALWEVLSTLCFGASLIIPTQNDILSIQQFYAILEKEKVTILNETPSAFEQLLLYEQTFAMKKLSLRYIILAGEALKPKNIKSWFKLYSSHSCKIINMYGITETTVYSTFAPVTESMMHSGRSIIGQGIPGVALYILDQNQKVLPPNVIGEIYIAGHGVGQGYLNLPELTAQRFLSNSISSRGQKIYKTGDIGRSLPNGDIEYLGRIDNQVKIRGYRVELEEIESLLLSHPKVKEVVAHVQKDELNEQNIQLVAYVIAITGASGDEKNLQCELEIILEKKVPDYMRANIMFLEKFPLMHNHKIDKNLLPKVSYKEHESILPNQPNSSIEKQIAKIWEEILNIQISDIDANFFDMGGNSLFAMQLHSKLMAAFACEIKIVDLFNYTNIRKLSEFIDKKIVEKTTSQSCHPVSSTLADCSSHAIAIIGMAGQFPGAENVDEFWNNLKHGIDSISRYTKEELHQLGVSTDVLKQEYFVGASGILKNIDLFDAEFFNVTPKEAALTDPQHRIMLEISHTALENAGYAPQKYDGRIAVYTGMGDSDYLYELMSKQKHEVLQSSTFMMRLANEKDYLATKVAYKLNLKGAAVNVNTACSSSLVAVIKACQSLANGEADIALAGGISVVLPNNTGYLCETGSIFSKNGFCKAFDETSTGTVPSSGAAMVVLKKLSDALQDGDTIHAVISGYAINNDGSEKMNFSAPSLKGQTDCIRQALSLAKMNPKDISYIEAHGTGTVIGDAIEIQALTQVFREKTDKTTFCALGSVKNNIGHTQSAAGVIGLIKAIYVAKEKIVPPHIHYVKPNLALDIENGPFLIHTEKKKLNSQHITVGVSSFGIGGTNAHLILQRYSPSAEIPSSETFKLLILSAKSPQALSAYRLAFQRFLQEKIAEGKFAPHDLDNLSYTLQVGREDFIYRQAFICQSADDAIVKLNHETPQIVCDLSLHHPELRKLYSLAEKWLAGEKIDWQNAHSTKRMRIPTPTYPYIRKKYWHDDFEEKNSSQREVSIVPLDAEREVQKRLFQIIAESLGYNEIKGDDNFFELGGDSLIAINIASRVEAEFGYKSNFDHISTLDNIELIIQKIMQSTRVKQKNSLLKKLKNGIKSLPFLFLIHPGNGSLFYYENLVQGLNYEAEIWGIENPVFESHYKPFNSIQEMASYYIQLIKSIQPTGPYLLSGWSLGASVAFEMTRQLEEVNECIESLILIDGWYKYNPRLNKNDFFYHLYEKDFSKIEENRKNLMINLLKRRFKLFMDYHPSLIKTAITLIKARKLTEEFNVSDPYNNWGPFTSHGIEVLHVNGDHLSMFSYENLKEVIQACNLTLEKSTLKLKHVRNAYAE